MLWPRQATTRLTRSCPGGPWLQTSCPRQLLGFPERVLTSQLLLSQFVAGCLRGRVLALLRMDCRQETANVRLSPEWHMVTVWAGVNMTPQINTSARIKGNNIVAERRS